VRGTRLQDAQYTIGKETKDVRKSELSRVRCKRFDLVCRPRRRFGKGQAPTSFTREPLEPVRGESVWDFRRRCLAWLGFETYEDYRNSSLWAAIRNRVHAHASHRCRYCHAPSAVVHHRRYTASGLQGTNDLWLVALCNDCHEKQHERGWDTIRDAGGETPSSHVKQLPCKRNQNTEEKAQRKAIRKAKRAAIKQFQCAKCFSLMKKGTLEGELCPRCRGYAKPKKTSGKKQATGEHHW